MSRLIYRDSFARQEMHREVIPAIGRTCTWCGQVRKGDKLYIYWTELDAVQSNRRNHNGQFCSIGCYDDYHGVE